jgi:hypothetical protein
VPTGDRFCRVLDRSGSVAAIEREYARALRPPVWRAITDRVATFFDAVAPGQTRAPQGL